jgi:hypothetical protein
MIEVKLKGYALLDLGKIDRGTLRLLELAIHEELHEPVEPAPATDLERAVKKLAFHTGYPVEDLWGYLDAAD